MNPATGEQQLILVSTDQEIAIGKEAAPIFIEQMDGRVESKELQYYVQTVGGRLAVVSDRSMPYQFTVLRSETPNAFALPGGKIFISVGMMRQLQNERQLAAVLGHEVAHVAALHNVQNIQRQMGVAIIADTAGVVADVFIGGVAGPAAEAGTKIVGNVASLGYSREDESQADEIGIRYLYAAGYNAWSMVEMLELLSEMSESESSKFANHFQTHPLTSRRIKDARRIIADEYGQKSAVSRDPNAARYQEMKKLLPSVE